MKPDAAIYDALERMTAGAARKFFTLMTAPKTLRRRGARLRTILHEVPEQTCAVATIG